MFINYNGTLNRIILKNIHRKRNLWRYYSLIVSKIGQ